MSCLGINELKLQFELQERLSVCMTKQTLTSFTVTLNPAMSYSLRMMLPKFLTLISLIKLLLWRLAFIQLMFLELSFTTLLSKLTYIVACERKCNSVSSQVSKCSSFFLDKLICDDRTIKCQK